MPHPLTDLGVDTIRKSDGSPAHEISADLCVVGAGIAGVSTAVEAARLGREVVLVDSMPVLGGQMVNSLIGLFCGVFGNAPEHRQLTHGIFDDLFADLGATGDLHFQRSHTTTVYYDEVALARWVERRIRELGVRVVLSAVIDHVEWDGRRLASVTFASRYGDVVVDAPGFVDATGDASLVWEAGLPCRVPERPIYGSQQVLVEHVDEAHQPGRDDVAPVLAAKGEEYGLVRRDGLAFFFPGRGTAVLNMTHVEAPLDPVRAAAVQLDGREQADRVLEFLRAQFPEAFGNARVRTYGFPGRRQTRWITGAYQITVDDVRTGTRFADAVARTAWPLELHDRPEGYVWETFESDHVHYVPFRSMTPVGVDNVLAAGRCIDGDAAALSSVRVMGPCAAMGAAAAHAFDLAGKEPVGEVEPGALQERVRENLD